MKKKILLVALAAAMLLSAASCSTGGTTSSGGTVTGSANSQSESKSEPATEKPTEAKTAAIGDYVQSDTLKITLTGAKVYDEIVQNEYLKATPADGKKYLVLFLEAENLSDKDQYVNMFYYDAYADSKSIKAETLLAKPEDEDMFAGDLAFGKKLSGYVAYEVSKDWKEFEFTYKDGALSDSTKFTFAFSAGDIK